jgi:hypothetical protein
MLTADPRFAGSRFAIRPRQIFDQPAASRPEWLIRMPMGKQEGKEIRSFWLLETKPLDLFALL